MAKSFELLAGSLLAALIFTGATLAQTAPEQDLLLFVGRADGDAQAWEYLRNGSSPPWLRSAAWDLPDIGKNAMPSFGDLDGDGDLDVLIGRSQGDCLGYENTATAGAPAWQRNEAWDCPDIGQYAAPELADMDGDGDLDLLLGNSRGNIRVYRNKGDRLAPNWNRMRAWEIARQEQYATPRLCHLDADARLDLLVGSRFYGVRAFRNAGGDTAPDWQRMDAWDLFWGGERTTMAPGDLDGDGDCDLMLGQRGGPVTGYRNTGDRSNGPTWLLEPDWFLGVGVGKYTAPALLAVAAGPGEPDPALPIAEAGMDRTLVDQDGDGVEQVMLDGSGSSTPDGALSSYVWTEMGNELGVGETATVDLAVGAHVITLTVMDDRGQSASDTVKVTIEPAPVLLPAGEIDIERASMVFHYHNVNSYDTYGPADYLYLNGYLKKAPEEPFAIPLDKDVTVTIEIPDPVDPSLLKQVFFQTIPPGTATGTATRYRYSAGKSGIVDIQFMAYNSTSIYFYLELGKIMFLPEYKNASCHESLGCPITALEYRDNYILPITDFTVTVDTDGGLWRAEVPLRRGGYNEHYQHLDLDPGR